MNTEANRGHVKEREQEMQFSLSGLYDRREHLRLGDYVALQIGWLAGTGSGELIRACNVRRVTFQLRVRSVKPDQQVGESISIGA